MYRRVEFRRAFMQRAPFVVVASLAFWAMACASPVLAQINETLTSPYSGANAADIVTTGDAIHITTSGIGSTIDLLNSGALNAGGDGIETITGDGTSSIVIDNRAPIIAGETGITALTFGTGSPITINSTGTIDAGTPGTATQITYGLPNIDANGAFNGGTGNVGAFNGLNNFDASSGNANTGSFNGNFNGNDNTGAGNGLNNGNNNTGAFNGNWNGNGNTGDNNGLGNGNGDTGAFNGNQNGNGNSTSGAGNSNGSGNNGTDNGVGNGNGTLIVTNSSFGQIGIFATTLGDNSSINISSGNVNAGMIGVFGQTLGASSNLSITTRGDVNAGDFAVFGLTVKNGSALSITTDGKANAKGFGIFGLTLGTGADLKINANGQTSGGEYGILGAAVASRADIGVGGAVSGGSFGVFLNSGTGSSINVASGGSISAGNDRAIHVEGAATAIDNSGTIRGFVELTGQSDTFDIRDTGLFDARMTSDFGAGTDRLTNAGTIRAATDAGTLETVGFVGLESLVNGSLSGGPGLISLSDGQAGDCLVINGTDCSTFASGASFVGQGSSSLAVDAYLAGGAAGTSDTLLINGDASGHTTVLVHNTNPDPSPNFVGIPVVKVTGATSESDFDLDKPLTAGFFTWDLFLDTSPASFDQHELVTVGFGPGAFEMPMALTAAQDIWHNSSATVWLDRQADLRICLAMQDARRAGDTAGSECKVKPGVWAKGQGAWVSRDGGTQSFTAQGRNYSFDRGYDLSLSGLVSGVDGGWDNVLGTNDTALLGLMGGYIDTDVNFNGGTRWALKGPILGAYATYLNEGFYFDTLFKADFLGVDVYGNNLGGNGKTNLVNLGVRIDSGYQVALGGGYFIEPQVMLAGVRSRIDDLDIFGGTVAFDTAESLRGRLGARTGFAYETRTLALVPDVTMSVWREFQGDNKATISPPSVGDLTVAQDAGSTFGEVALGLNAVSRTTSWSAFARGHVQFGEDYLGSAVRAGFRYAW